MRRLLYILPLVAFAAVAAWFAVGLQRDPNKLPSALLNREVPAFDLPAIPGVAAPGFASAAVKGKVTLINMFASWCVPCRAEHPILMRLQREGRVAIYGINYKDTAADAVKYLAQLGNPYSAIGQDLSGRVGIDFGLYGVPETYVVDREGRIRYRLAEAITPQILQNTLLPLIAGLEAK